jgi:hypothetical protein
VDWLLFAACCHAGLSGVAGEPGSGVSAAEGPVEAGRAIELLRRAVDGGLRDRGRVCNEAALEPLRLRSDFQVLLMDMAMPIDPFTRGD